MKNWFCTSWGKFSSLFSRCPEKCSPNGDALKMYLDFVLVKDFGPISQAFVKAEFSKQGQPKPIILVGKNGTGKSILISTVVDSLHEIARNAYDDIVIEQGAGYKYFKIASGSQVKIGAKGGVSYVRFAKIDKKDQSAEYMYREGVVGSDALQPFNKELGDARLKISIIGNGRKKEVSVDKSFAKECFARSAICYFPPDRYSVPDWQGVEYSRKSESIFAKEKYSNILGKPIRVACSQVETIDWLVNVLVDAKADLAWTEHGIVSRDDVGTKVLLSIARQNVEEIFSSIIEQNIEFSLGYRTRGMERIIIKRKGTRDEILMHSLGELSTGQATLFELFATIIRYADSNDLNKSIRLSEITGIVIIDEADLHLHADLQRKVLPLLIKKFPKVQFIISTHSPLFVLGMREACGEDGFNIYEMPTAQKITAEEFSEFQKAYDFLQDSSRAAREKEALLNRLQEELERVGLESKKTLIVTEGATDWKHIKRALNVLSDEYDDISRECEFLEYGSDGDGDAKCFIEMGGDELCEMCKQISKVPQKRRWIFIADADKADVTKKVQGQGGRYKSWGNNVFSFVIPVPRHRNDIAHEVCIEHYYTDEEIKTSTEIGGVSRRLYLAKEFSSRMGLSDDKSCMYEDFKNANKSKRCGKIIDGQSGQRVSLISEDEEFKTNLCISKNQFDSNILNNHEDFKHLSSDNFRLILDVIKDILKEK